MVRIITDSAADFEPNEVQRLNIDYIPIKVLIGQQEYLDSVELTKDRFFQLLAQTGESPHQT